MSEIFAVVLKANIAAAAAILLVLPVRAIVRRLAGAHAAYLSWALVPVAMIATLVPARTSEAIRIEDAGSMLKVGAEIAPVVGISGPSQLDWEGVLVPAGSWVWLAGMIAGIVFLIVRQMQFSADARRGLAGPAVMGVMRPRIVTPSDFDQRYDEGERELILAHESAHAQRGDARLNAAIALAQCICWFNPLMHVGARLMRIDQELSCDALVVEQRPHARRAYAETLLKTQLAGRPLPFGCYWPARSSHPLTQRIAMLAAAPASGRRKLAAGALVLLSVMSCGAAAWAVQPEQPPSAEPTLYAAVIDADASAKRAYETYQRVFELMGGRFPRASDTPTRYQELLGDRWVDADRARNILEGLDPDVRIFLASRPDTRLIPGGRQLQAGEVSALTRMTDRYAAYFEQLKATPLSNN